MVNFQPEKPKFDLKTPQKSIFCFYQVRQGEYKMKKTQYFHHKDKDFKRIVTWVENEERTLPVFLVEYYFEGEVSIVINYSFYPGQISMI